MEGFISQLDPPLGRACLAPFAFDESFREKGKCKVTRSEKSKPLSRPAALVSVSSSSGLF